MLLGRTREVSEIDGLLRDVRAGRGRAVLLSGDAGIGKTALLDHARDQAIGLRVLGTMGVEAEANLPFAALAEIAGPLVDYVGALPPVQAGAIRAALALGDADPPPSDRLAVCAGLVTLLRAAAEDWPLLLVVDDAQWLDLPSAECLGYAARRLDGARVAVLAAARADEPVRALSGRPVTELRLGGLEPADAEALLRAAGGELAPSAAAALLDAARGNPLALLELPGLLSQEQRLGLEPFAPAPAPGGDLWEALSRRLDALSPGARTAVLVASASIDRTTGPVMGGCSELGAGVDAIEELEQARILRLDGDHVVFVHPLMRGVVAAMGDGADQRRVHAALAKHASPDARPWHLASATVGRSAQVADALDEAGWRAVSRGAHAAAADAFARAADFSEAAGLRIPRQINAALEAAIGGEYERAAAMLDDISDISDPATAVAARHLMAMVTLTGGIRPALESHATLTADAARIADIAPELAADVLADAGVAAVVSGDCRLARASAERAAELLPETATPTTRCHVLAILGMTRALRGDTIGADTALQQAGRLLGDVDPLSAAAQSISFSLHGRLSTGRGAALRDEVLGLGAAAQSAGARGLVPYYLLVAADAAFRLGGWAAAERDVTDAVEIAELSAQRGPLSVALVVRGRVRAARGDEHGARRDLSDALAAAAAPGYGSTRIWAHAALGFLELGLGHPEPAIVELELTSDLSERAGLVDPVIVPWMPDLVEAYCRTGQLEEAVALTEELEDRAADSPVALAQALAARGVGLVAQDDFETPMQRALDLHARASSPFEEARTLLAYGTRLHRARRRLDARERLRAAHEAFTALGAQPWAERAQAELRAAGAIRRLATGDPDELTAQEVRIALAVARGATNREVAAELFLSPKTVEFHLSRVYRKLGVRSRTELAALVAEGVVAPN